MPAIVIWHCLQEWSGLPHNILKATKRIRIINIFLNIGIQNNLSIAICHQVPTQDQNNKRREETPLGVKINKRKS